MANKIASVMVAIGILAAAFLLIPEPPSPEGAQARASAMMPAADEAGAAVASGPVGEEPTTSGGNDGPAAQPEKNGGQKVIDACKDVIARIEAMSDADFVQQVGDQLHSTMEPDAVVAMCGEIARLDDAALLATVTEKTGLAP